MWTLLTICLIQAPIWDEQNMVLYLDREPLHQAWRDIWQQAPGEVFRPIPQLVMLVIWHLLGGQAHLAFPGLRLVTAACHACGMALLIARRRPHVLDGRRASGWGLSCLLLVAMLFSPSGLVIAGWFANIYDAMVTLSLGLAVRCAQRRLWLGAGMCLGLAFFCKESALLGLAVLPILGLLPRTRRERLHLLAPLLLGMLGYAALRQQRIALGSAADLHGFALQHVLTAAGGLLAGLPFGGVPASPWLAFAGCVLSLLWWRSLHAPARPYAVLVWLLTALLYAGMLPMPGARPLIHWSHFQGRLFAMPLLLAALATLRYGHRPLRTAGIALLALSIPGAFFVHDHLHFQRLYRCMLTKAQEQHGMMVHFPEKPLEDGQLGLRIGTIPNASCRLEPWSGTLTCQGQVVCPRPRTKMKEGPQAGLLGGAASLGGNYFCTSMRRACWAGFLGMTTSNTPFLPLAWICSGSAVSGRLKRR